MLAITIGFRVFQGLGFLAVCSVGFRTSAICACSICQASLQPRSSVFCFRDYITLNLNPKL